MSISYLYFLPMSIVSISKPPEKKVLIQKTKPTGWVTSSFADTLLSCLEASPELQILQSQENRDSKARTLRVEKRDSHRWELGRELPKCDRARITPWEHIISD